MILIGIDEVGRGCWAGPVVAGAVALQTPLPGLKDSKKLTARTRLILDAEIKVASRAWALGWVSAEQVDAHGLTAAVGQAMRIALSNIAIAFDEVIIDGNINFLSDLPGSRAVVRADDLVPAVSAASIIAKVARDAFMAQQALRYPQYGFESHVGYGTAAHARALKAHGPTPLHRHSFKPVKALL